MGPANAVTTPKGIAMRRFVPSLAAVAALGIVAAAVAGTNAASATATTNSLWSTSDTPVIRAVADDPAGVELGVRVKVAQSGAITAIRFYKGPGNTGSHTATLWSANGHKLATGTLTHETAVGWQTLILPTPVAVSAGATYVASYHAPHGHYADDTGYFTVPRSAGLLTAPRNAGVYAYGRHVAFPTRTWRASNYWVDIVLAPIAPPTTSTTTTSTNTTTTATTMPTPPPTTTTTTSPSPPAGNWPTAATTGAQGPLAPTSGDITLSTTGQVYQNSRVTGTLTVTGCNVTIRNVEVDAGEPYSGNATPDLFAIWNKAPQGCTTTLDHVSVLTNTSGPAPYATEAVRDAYGSTQNISASKFVGQQLGVTVGGGDTIRDSYMELGQTLRGDHNEDILDDGATGLMIEHNTLLNPNGQTSVLSLFTEFGSNRNILVTNNLLAGGGFTCYCGDGARDNVGNPARATDVSFVGNVFWRRYFPTVGQFGPGRAYNPAGGGRWFGNVYMDVNGTPTTETVPQPPLDGQ
jgi:hypothetical protein